MSENYIDSEGNKIPHNLITDYLITNGFPIKKYKQDGDYIEIIFFNGYRDIEMLGPEEDFNSTDMIEEFSSLVKKGVDIDSKKRDMSEKESTFKTTCDSIARMLEAKNKAYGESALKPLGIFAKHHNYGSRIDEKLARVQNADTLKKNDVADIIGGLLIICKDKGWDNFDDLID